MFGAGTIGLLAAYSALIKGAAEVYVVDSVSERLDKAAEIGAVPVDYRQGDPVEQIRGLRQDRGLAPGEEAMRGVEAGIDAVGFQARDRLKHDVENPGQIVGDLARLVNPSGHLAVIGVYAEKDLNPAPEGNVDGRLTVPWGTFFSKGISVRFGRTHDRRYTVLLRDMVLSGRARPSVVVTHHGRLDDAPGLYRAFDRRAEGVVKAVLRP
ncbi:zinc-binding dehydrogenase [Nonomuraea cypriaca]|uniref:zinc-binding dehydrogenase n=1 Tax=Nonomuraea cypriaca TaxID=1187855 RepID=UPI001A9CA12E|nr:zinc-binding dehydrogenase [Nonomuraea cypriaca]